VAYEEKRAWIMLVVSVCAYAAYLIIIVGRAGPTPLAELSYESTLLWSIGVAIAVQIGLGVIAGLGSPKARKKDQRDREIGRLSEYIGQSFVVIGGVAALLMALAELDYFWIANVIYLTFVLSAALGSVAKIFAYRRGFQSW
jgi:cell division protein FtsW (lipid II flippase)